MRGAFDPSLYPDISLQVDRYRQARDIAAGKGRGGYINRPTGTVHGIDGADGRGVMEIRVCYSDLKVMSSVRGCTNSNSSVRARPSSRV